MPKPEDQGWPQKESALTSATSTEIVVHLFVLIAVLVPVLTILFPAMLLLVGATMLASEAPDSFLSQWLTSNQYASLVVACMTTLLIGAVAILWKERHSSDSALKLRELSGVQGERLREMVGTIWAGLGSDKQAPHVRWFPALDVAAYAFSRNRQPEIQISAGLWRAATTGEPIAKAILAHEMAHIVHHDPRTLKVLQALVTALSAIMLITGLFALIMLIYIVTEEIFPLLANGDGITAILLRLLIILAGAAMVLVLLPLGWLAFRRQISFVTSLIEIRADVTAAAWTGGLEEFTQAFASNENVVKTSGSAFRHALYSASFSHIPQRERLTILSTPELVVTPKIAFFAMSILLLFLLPINFGTPLLLGGAPNHFAVQALSAAFNASIIGMIVLGFKDSIVSVTKSRLFLLSAVSCLVTAIPRINLEPVSYLGMSWFMGFGGQPLDLDTLSSDTVTTLKDLADKVHSGFLNWGTIFAIVINYCALRSLTRSADGSINLALRLVSGTAAAIFGSFLAGYDSYRALPFPFAEWLNGQFGDTPPLRGMTLSLPLALAALVEALIHLLAVRRRTRD
ncbi:M48 family metalloprotease [Rhizobium sp. WYCCWR10014]|uniref:M48 family metalloprotease n=1 Tax=Rhizobium sp. WYCCWR10014 TaxID=1825933 RepID=UPI000A73A33A|nr:M48 family metalloprotease [Rhizobium sp. WYCCWR10014]